MRLCEPLGQRHRGRRTPVTIDHLNQKHSCKPGLNWDYTTTGARAAKTPVTNEKTKKNCTFFLETGLDQNQDMFDKLRLEQTLGDSMDLMVFVNLMELFACYIRFIYFKLNMS